MFRGASSICWDEWTYKPAAALAILIAVPATITELNEDAVVVPVPCGLHVLFLIILNHSHS
jgi:hypothetical protein